MGYEIVSGTEAEALSDEVWMKLAALAVKHGFSAPRLGSLERSEQVDLTRRRPQGSTQRLSEHYLRGSPPNTSHPKPMR